jgi:hypothetical protein
MMGGDQGFPPYQPGLIRRGKIGGQLQGMTGQLGAQGEGWQEICRITDLTAGDPVTREGGDADSNDHTIYTSFSNLRASIFFPVPKVLVRIQVADGNDIGAGMVEMVVLAGTPVTVSGSSIFVSAQLFLDELGVNKAPPTVSCDVNAFVTVGSGEDIEPTRWPLPLAPLQSSQQVTTKPTKLRSWQGFNSGAVGTITYLMAFDFPGPAIASPVVVPNGTPPKHTIPLPGGATFSDDFIESVSDFAWGFAWACSTTPDVYTPDGAQLVRVEPELYSRSISTGIV